MQPLFLADMLSRPWVIAHRGASREAPENTLAAIVRAVALGVDAIEIDVHLTADGTPVLLHDATLCRTTDADRGRAIRATRDHELSALDAGVWFHGRVTGEKVPTLEAVLRMDLGGIPLMVELKDDLHHDLSKAVLQLLAPIHPVGWMASFSHSTIAFMQREHPEYPLIGIADTMEAAEVFLAMGITHLALDHALVTVDLVGKYHRRGIVLWVFTVDDPCTAEKLIRCGVDGLISNDPATFIS